MESGRVPVYGLVLAAAVIVVAVRVLTFRRRHVVRSRKLGAGVPEFMVLFPFGLGKLLQLYRDIMSVGPLDAYDALVSTTPKKTWVIHQPDKFTIVTREPENAKSILALDFNSYHKGYRHGKSRESFLGHGIFASSGPHWRWSRNLLRPIFSRENISRLDKVEQHAQMLLKRVGTESAKGVPFDMYPCYLMMTIDTITELLFGDSFDTLRDPETPLMVASDGQRITAQRFKELVDFIGTVLARRSQVVMFYWLITSSRFRNNIRLTREVAAHIVETSRKRVANGEHLEKGHVSIVDDLVAQGDLDDQTIGDQIWNVFLAGRGTTAALLSFVTWHLARRPQVWQQFREVVLETYGDTPESITFENLRQFTLLNHIINETLRMHPLVVLLGRTAYHDTTIPRGGGPNGDEPLLVPKGGEVLVSIYHMQRDPDYWGPDAHLWRPERWQEHNRRFWEFIPFSGGPRICLGQQIALSEAAYVLVRLAQAYEHIIPSPAITGEEPPIEARVTIAVKGGVPVYFK